MEERQKIIMEPGKKYRGYGYINEYGEMHFEPTQQGASPNNMKIVRHDADYTLYESKNYWRMSVKVKKSNDKMTIISNFILAMQRATVMLRSYLSPTKIKKK